MVFPCVIVEAVGAFIFTKILSEKKWLGKMLSISVMHREGVEKMVCTFKNITNYSDRM